MVVKVYLGHRVREKADNSNSIWRDKSEGFAAEETAAVEAAKLRAGSETEAAVEAEAAAKVEADDDNKLRIHLPFGEKSVPQSQWLICKCMASAA
jgi:U3 small nucleolar RNA-associated protein 14